VRRVRRGGAGGDGRDAPGPVGGVGRCRRDRNGFRGLLLRDPHDLPVRRGGRLRPVRGLAVQRGDGHTSADQGDGGGDQGPALRLLPALPLPTPRRPAHRRGRRDIDIRAVVRLLLRRPAEFLGAGIHLVPRGGWGLPLCPTRRGVRGPCSDGEGSDVRGVGAAPGAYEGAVEMPTTRGAVVHLGSSCVHFRTGERVASKGSEAFHGVCAACVTLLRRCVPAMTAVRHIHVPFPSIARHLTRTGFTAGRGPVRGAPPGCGRAGRGG